ncbi:charged multivesicular body protein 6-A-like [Mizuhopecten yessoensis]|uniref:Charged multivesicular body protein 6 n=1 Tax=Mizuhopecten yessoensis TaxID=6573 RepID=A0A210QCJ3_MIZYE|nr:charged multivesicular body protein 6-A-like [Mizuhopecten yessoensis]XP_021361622.1 charged multivesicular body protein 6-A-like [Mizuhopecten yessoensis]OWF46476.1 Charged multivesicular body protein 6 [Mizuhopecten yessoensis]
MGRSSSKPKKQPSRVTEQDKAVLQLKQQRDKLRQYQKKIHVQIEKDRQVAKQLLHDGKKSKAKLMLRKKRFQESLIEKTDGQLENIEQMVHDLEFSQIEAKVFEGLKKGNESLKKLHEIMSIEDVEKLMDETQESIEYQKEIDDLLAGGLTEDDEEDVLAELDELTKQDMALPDVPTDELPEIQKEKEKKRAQREERQAEMVPAS